MNWGRMWSRNKNSHITILSIYNGENHFDSLFFYFQAALWELLK